MNNLEITTEKLFKQFSSNNLKANASKCHLFISLYQPVPVNARGSITESRNCEKSLGIYTDSKITTWMGHSFKTKTTKSRATFLR